MVIQACNEYYEYLNNLRLKIWLTFCNKVVKFERNQGIGRKDKRKLHDDNREGVTD